jgi:hypothetical protein
MTVPTASSSSGIVRKMVLSDYLTEGEHAHFIYTSIQAPSLAIAPLPRVGSGVSLA